MHTPPDRAAAAMPLYPLLNVPHEGGEPSLSPEARVKAGAMLAARRRAGLRAGLLPDAFRPRHHADALAVQAEVARALGWPVAGWKCGLPGPGKLVVAPIYAPTVCRSGTGDGSGMTEADVPTARAWTWSAPSSPSARQETGGAEGVVRVEPELAFVLKADLPCRAAPWSPQEVDAAIGSTHLALELIDSRYELTAVPSFDDKLADGLVNQGLFVGPMVGGEAARAAVRFPITVQVPGQAEVVHEGVMPDGPPRGPLYWLAEFLRQQGTGLQAGQTVITGSYAGAFNLPVGPVVRLRYGDLGTLSVRLQAREGVILQG